MSQESKNGRIADDFPAIAARLHELAPQSRQAAVRLECGTCRDKGWVWSSTALDWQRCPRCGMSQYHPKPQPRR